MAPSDVFGILCCHPYRLSTKSHPADACNTHSEQNRNPPPMSGSQGGRDVGEVEASVRVPQRANAEGVVKKVAEGLLPRKGGNYRLKNQHCGVIGMGNSR